jgi:hypothetical protein
MEGAIENSCYWSSCWFLDHKRLPYSLILVWALDFLTNSRCSHHISINKWRLSG